ncbi:MAG TPA: MoaD/ThiS family protein [Acetobacteraceae bacterium]|jgi:molybdopterin converting factor small subunit|nr:MoaD/ThiS family protein [Acetobacteraceae bacterium]
MPHVVIMGSVCRPFTGGQTDFQVTATTFRKLIGELEARFPGLGKQVEDGMAVAIDGVIHQDSFGAALNPESEIVLIPKIGGG